MTIASMKFFSKMLDLKFNDAFVQYGITEEKLTTKAERDIYNFIDEYINRNGETPTPEEVSVKFDQFVYTPTNSSFDVLATEINDQHAKNEIIRLIQGKINGDDEFGKKDNLNDQFNIKSGFDLVEFLETEIEKIKAQTLVQKKFGFSLTEDTDWFLEEYERRSEGKSFKVWKSKFPTLNKVLGGGYAGGNVYAWFARSGRGKSVVVLEEAIEAAMQGATVLYWALEMIAFELYCRAFSSISARQGIFNAKIDGIDYDAGFPQKEMLMGKLSPEFKERLKQFIKDINEIVPGKIIFRSVDDPQFYDRSVRQLEAEILKTKADVVVIDAIYLMDTERNTSKVAGGDLAQTSKKIRQLAGRTSTVIHTITQAEETNEEENEETGQRELQIPTRKELKKSKQIMEDASLTIGLDTVDGRGILVPRKGRMGGEGQKIEIIYLPNYGIVRELPTAEEVKEYLMDNPQF